MAKKKVIVEEKVAAQTVVETQETITTQSPEKVKSKLVGCDVVLDPIESGMFMDATNKITLGFMAGQSDRCKITEEMDLTVIKKNIAKGILRVFKDGNDITVAIGGPNKDLNWKIQPIVKGAHKMIADSDTPLVAILNRNSQTEVIKTVKTLKNYKTLSRLRELEEMGKNPASQPRADVINAIGEEMDTVSGMSEAGLIKEDKPDVIKVK